MLVIGLSLLVSVLSSANVLADVSVGVNEGDWIEYEYIYTGSTLVFSQDWAKIDFTSIQGTNVTIMLTGLNPDGENSTTSTSFDLETGSPVILLIPTNLDVGDEIYHEEYGNFTIAGTEEGTYAGAKRTVIYATVSNQFGQTGKFYWDKITGILLQQEQSNDGYDVKMRVNKTNIWQAEIFGSEPIFGIEPTILYALLIAVIVIIALVAIFLFRKKNDSQIKADDTPISL